MCVQHVDFDPDQTFQITEIGIYYQSLQHIYTINTTSSPIQAIHAYKWQKHNQFNLSSLYLSYMLLSDQFTMESVRPRTRLRATIQTGAKECDSDTSYSAVYVIPHIGHVNSFPALQQVYEATNCPGLHPCLSHANFFQFLFFILTSCENYSPPLSAGTPGSTLSSHTPVPAPMPRRNKRPLQRYGEWVCHQTAEYFV